MSLTLVPVFACPPFFYAGVGVGSVSDSRSEAGGGIDGDSNDGGGDDDKVATVASPVNAVSEVVGALFESEARVAVEHVLREVCPWYISYMTTRNMALGGLSRQVDLFAYCYGDSFAPCADSPNAGIFVVWPDLSNEAVTEPSLPAAAIAEGTNFSPADPARFGP